MPLYLFKCSRCETEFEKVKPMVECGKDEACPKCGQSSHQVLVPPHVHWGWTLTEASHHNGNDDEFISRRPSNEGLIRA